MLAHRIFYLIKPLLPRSLQITIRRRIVLRKRELCKDVWPIDEKAGKVPEGWTGWPENKRFALVLTHDVDTAKGQEKCKLLMELEKNLGFRSSFNFVPRRYDVQVDLRNALNKDGFEVGVHGLYHDGRYYDSWEKFSKRAVIINKYLKEWGSVGYRSPSMLHNLNWIHALNIEYDASTFDTDPFEPQPDGFQTIFPFYVKNDSGDGGYVELPYTLPQDFTLFILIGESDINIWKRKLDWIVKRGGMALLNVHPDYMNFREKKSALDEYPVKYYEKFLKYVKTEYGGQFWNVIPKVISDFWINNMVKAQGLPNNQFYDNSSG
jgi:hypothetical protein